jgi:hypothetical protein
MPSGVNPVDPYTPARSALTPATGTAIPADCRHPVYYAALTPTMGTIKTVSLPSPLIALSQLTITMRHAANRISVNRSFQNETHAPILSLIDKTCKHYYKIFVKILK